MQAEEKSFVGDRRATIKFIGPLFEQGGRVKDQVNVVQRGPIPNIAVIKPSDRELTLPSNANPTEIEIRSNAAWSIHKGGDKDGEWISNVDPSDSKGDKKPLVTLKENKEAEERTGYIIFETDTYDNYDPDRKIDKLNIVQRGKPKIAVSPGGNTITLQDARKGSNSFTVTNVGDENLNWKAQRKKNAGWIPELTGSSTNEGTVDFSYEANTKKEDQSATVEIVDPNATNSPAEVTVTQPGVNLSVKASNNKLTFAPWDGTEKQAQIVKIEANRSWKVKSVTGNNDEDGDNWLSYETLKDENKVKVWTSLPNTAEDNSKRTAEITLVAGEVTKTLTVLQTARPFLTVTPNKGSEKISPYAKDVKYTVTNSGEGTLTWGLTNVDSDVGTSTKNTTLRSEESGSFTLSIPTNKDASSEEYKIEIIYEIKSGGESIDDIKKKVNLAQKGINLSISTPRNQPETLSAAKTKGKLIIQTNYDWKAEVKEVEEKRFTSINTTSGSNGKHTIEFTASNNKNSKPRRDTILVRSGKISEELELIQQGQTAEPAIGIADLEGHDLEIGPESGTKQFTVENSGGGSLNWNASFKQEEFSVADKFKNGSAGDPVKIKYVNNKSSDPRTDTLEITSKDAINSPYNLIVTQKSETVQTYLVSGKILTSNSKNPLASVELTLDGYKQSSTTTDKNGQYSFTNLPNGDYIVKPSKSGYSFKPTEQKFSISGGDIEELDFQAQKSSDNDITPPAKPTGLSASYENGIITLSWDANTEEDLKQYKLYRAATGNPETSMATVDAGTELYDDGDIDKGISYYYRITAIDNADNESSYSNEVSVQVPEDNLSEVITVNAKSNGGSASVSQDTWKGEPENMIDGDPNSVWQVAYLPDQITAVFKLAEPATVQGDTLNIGGTGGGRSVSQYEIYKRSSANEDWELATTINTSVGEGNNGKKGHQYDNAIKGKQFKLVITQHNAPSGCGTSCDVPINEFKLVGNFEGSVEDLIPDSPQDLIVQGSGSDVQLSWSQNSSSQIINYIIYSGSDPYDLTKKTTVPASRTSYTISNTNARFFGLKAENNIGNHSNLAGPVSYVKMQKQISNQWQLIGNSTEKKLNLGKSITAYTFDYSYEKQNTLSPTAGSWVKSRQGATLDFSGAGMEKDTLKLSQGWNLIGSLSDTASVHDPNGILNSTPIYTFDSNGRSYKNVNELHPAKGHWIYAAQKGEIYVSILNNKSIKRQSGPKEKQKQYDHIIFSNEQGSKKLLFADKLTNQQKETHRLPPKMPDPVLDVRTSAGYGVADGETTPVKITSTQYPVQVKIKKQANKEVGYRLVIRDGEEVTKLPLSTERKQEIKRDQGQVSLKQIPKEKIVVENDLKPNYPNPFNPTTTIKYKVSQTADVELRVYNVLGQQVRQLVDKQKQPGTYQVRFDGSNLASGIYFLRLRIGEFSDLQKMTLIK